ncbi:MAG: fumarate hydratase [Candidatus Glassbacteria bacterium]
MELDQALVELVRRTSTSLPRDVEAALVAGMKNEREGSSARNAMQTIIENIRLARKKGTPICQDTGTPIFYVRMPVGVAEKLITETIRRSIKKATKLAYLRPNSVCPITGKNPGDNTGNGFPVIHFHQWKKGSLRFDLLLKGGGSENVGIQYKLPDARLGAGRDLDGVRKAVLDAVVQAGGKGCSPGALAVVVGGDRSSSYSLSKELFLKKLSERNPDPVLAKLEKELLADANSLDIGPMGLGGKTTLLDVKLASLHRVPASFFVTVSYGCWAVRRRSMTYSDGNARFT